MGTIVKLSSQLKCVWQVGNTFSQLAPPVACTFVTQASGGNGVEDSLPKRPVNAFNRYVKEKSPEVRKQFPDEKQTEIMKKIAKKWSQTSLYEKRRFQVQFEKEMEAYKKKMELMEPPKKPLTPYAAYLRDNYPLLKNRFTNLKSTEIMKKVAEKWKTEGAFTKQRYAKNYQAQMESFNAKLTDEDLLLVQKKKNEKVAKAEMKASKEDKQFIKNYGSEAFNNRPKEPTGNAYTIFIKEQKGVLSGKDFMKNSALKWGKLTEAQKQVYSKKADQRYDAYEAELEEWAKKYLGSPVQKN